MTYAYGKIKSKEIAEEIVQDVFLDLWTKKGSTKILSFEPYLITAVKYQTLKRMRAQLVEKKYWDYYKRFIPASENSTERTVHYNNLHQYIEGILQDLPHKTREVFYLNRYEGKSVKEIASRFKLSEKAVEYHLTRSLRQLRIHLKDFIFVALIYLSSR